MNGSYIIADQGLLTIDEQKLLGDDLQRRLNRAASRYQLTLQSPNKKP